jgi:hypothetical protein
MKTQLRPFSGTLSMVFVSIVWPTELSCVCIRGASVGDGHGLVVAPGLSVWRRDRDSNPGYLAVYTLSKRAPSATRPSLRRTLNLPHDWAVELPFVHDEEQNSHGYKPLGRRYPETSVGWYRREFEIPAERCRAAASSVEFDGAFRDVLVWVNGCFIGRNDNGYAPFRFDSPTSCLGAKNCIVARVDAALATAGSTRARASIGMSGSPRPMRCIWAVGELRARRT